MSFSNDNADFQKKLLHWYALSKRKLPWRNSTNPYNIWLSEIILQQTRVTQGLPYYQEFTKKFPTIHDLANADEQDVLRTWQGLGYYSRARNLHKCARFISESYNGQFPESYNELLKLPGIGPYTAAAIASFAFNKPHAVVDGNVFRVLSRIFGIQEDIASSKGQRYFREVANEMIDKERPGEYNQAIMEFGALHCTPASPKCDSCVFQTECHAYAHSLQSMLPVKSKKAQIRKRYLNYVVLKDTNGIYLRPRTEKDIWQGLYDFPLLETSAPLEEEDALRQIYSMLNLPDQTVLASVSQDYTHLLSHQRLKARFYLLELENSFPPFTDPSIRYFTRAKIEELPKPVLISRYLNDYIF